MENQNQNQNRSLEMNNYKNVYQKNTTPSPISSKLKNNFFHEINNKENVDSNKQYLISDNSQSAINPLSKSRENLNTSNNLPNTNLFTAVEYNDIERVNELLKQDNSKINDLNEEGLSLLHIAVIKANLKMINLLLSYGADSNILSDKKKQTPLHLAYLNQNSLTEDIIKALIKFNANDNVVDSKNKKPSDYMTSSYKKNRHKKFDIYSNNDNSNIEYNNSAEKKSYLNNNTANTVTVVTIDNHLDSFLTTNKEDENKSNINNINTNSNNTIIQTPSKLEVDYDFNEIISINNSVEKSNNQIINNKSNSNINNKEENSIKEKKSTRRQYTFGKEEDYLKFLNKNSDLCKEINNINNNSQNNNLNNIDINNNYFSENKNEIEKNKKNEEEDQKREPNSNLNINKEDLDKTPKENEILNDSLEDNNNNENENEGEYEEKEELEEENEELYDSLKNSNILNKDNNVQNSFNLNNNSLTYTESVNVNGSNYQSKNKISTSNIQNGNNKNKNEIEDNENDNDEEIVLKPPYNDQNMNIYLKTNEQDKKETNTIDDILIKKIITKKRNSFKKIHKNGNLSRISNYSANNFNTNDNFRLTAFNNNDLNLGENDIFNYSLKSNKTNRTNYLSPSIHNKISEENKNSIKYLYKQKKRDSYNTLINRNNSYKNNNTIIHNGTDSRVGNSGDATQYSTQSQNNRRKNLINSKDKIKVIMNDNLSQNLYNNNKITEFNCNDNTNNIKSNINIYQNNNEIIDNNINLTYLKLWLNNLGLIDFLKNFTNNNIYDINNLVERMKSYQTKLRYETLESTLKIRTPGYVYRILCKLEADAGLIDPKIVKFMIRDGINNVSNSNIKRSINNYENNLNISISQSYYQCINCCKFNQIKKQKKNDLKYFLLRHNLINLYQNFYHNGFDMIEYVIIQMYSSFPINDDILENCFHIYDEKQRISTLKAIVSEMKIINRFMNSDEYNNNYDKNKVKYDNVIFEENENTDKSKIYMKNYNKNENESDCIMF